MQYDEEAIDFTDAAAAVDSGIEQLPPEPSYEPPEPEKPVKTKKTKQKTPKVPKEPTVQRRFHPTVPSSERISKTKSQMMEILHIEPEQTIQVNNGDF